MDRRAAKEILHVRDWLTRVRLIVQHGEAANRLARLQVLAPDGVEWALAIANRNFIIHRYDEISRELTWLTLSRDLPEWQVSLAPLFDHAARALPEIRG